jgi:MFS family permease
MSISNADMAGTDTLALPPEIGRSDGWRDKAAIVVMVGSNIFNILSLIVISPLVASIAAYFAEHAHDGVVLSLPFYDVSPQIAAQLMITLLNIGIMFAGPLLGLLAERLGYTRLLTVALGIYAVAGSAALYLQSPAGLLFSRLLLGLVSASISICCYSLIGLRFKGERRAKMLGYQSALVMLTGLIGLEASGEIAQIAGSWRAPFAIYLLAIPMFVLSLFAAKPSASVTAEEAPGFGVLLPMWPLYLVLIPFNLAAYMTSVHLSFVLQGDGLPDPSYQAPIMASSFLMNILTSLLYTRIGGRFSRRWIFAALLGIFAASDIIIGFSTNWVGTMIGTWVAGLGGGLMTPFFVNIILNRAPETARARAIGLMYTMMYIGDFVNPFVITPLRLKVGNHEVFAVVGVILLGTALIQALSRRSPLGQDMKLQTA